MNDKILAAIEQSLPQVQVTMIHKSLAELDQLREETKDYKTKLADYKKTVTELEAANRESKVVISSLTTERDELIARNKLLEAQDVENRVIVVQAELNGVVSTTDKFLRNTIYRESLQHQVVDEGQNVQTHWNGQTNVPVPINYKTHRGVTDVKTSGADLENV